MREIRLYGHLRRFGRSFTLDVRTPAEAVRALCSQLPGFRAHVLAHSAPGYRVLVDRSPIGRSELHHPLSKEVIKLVPVVAGAGKWSQIILGVALIAISFVPGLQGVAFAGFSLSAAAMNMGLSMLLGGISQMLADSPQQSGSGERPENRPSYAFNGAVNTTGQGNAVPVGYGRVEIGSQVISAGLAVEQI